HLHDLATDANLLRTSAGEEPGTVGWLLRVSAMWQSRLIIIDAPKRSLPLLRRLGQEIVDRSGPAVLVADTATFNPVGLYASLFHDRPFDWAQRNVPGLALFGGAGREEALRFSIVADRLSKPQSAEVILNSIREVKPKRIAPKRLQPTVDEIHESITQAAQDLRIDIQPQGLHFGPTLEGKRIRFGDAVAAHMLDKGYIVRPLDSDLKDLGWPTEFVPVQTVAGYVAAKSLSLDDVLDPSTVPRIDDIIREKIDNLADSLKVFKFEDHEG